MAIMEENPYQPPQRQADPTSIVQTSPHPLRRAVLGLVIGPLVAGCWTLFDLLLFPLGVQIEFSGNLLEWMLVGLFAAIWDRHSVVAGAAMGIMLGVLRLIPLIFSPNLVAEHGAALILPYAVGMAMFTVIGTLTGAVWMAVRVRYLPAKPVKNPKADDGQRKVLTTPPPEGLARVKNSDA
jgi:hypothetical protein